MTIMRSSARSSLDEPRLRTPLNPLDCASEIVDNRARRPCADDAGEFFARRSLHAVDAAEFGQQLLAPPGPDPGDRVDLRTQVARGAPLTMERHGKAMG